MALVSPLSAQADRKSFHVSLPEGTELTNLERQVVAISPQGTRFVYVSQGSLYIRGTGDAEPVRIPGLLDGFRKANPVLSPDGQSIAYWAMDGSVLKRVPVTGGTPVTICAAEAPYGMSWGPDDQIVFGEGTKGIWRVSAKGGAPETIVKADRGEVAHGPQMLPGGDEVLFTLGDEREALSARWDRARIVVQSLKSGERKTLVPAGHDGRYLPSGHLVYALNGHVMAVRFDAKQLVSTGQAVRVIDDVLMANAGATGAAQFSVSANGVLVYISRHYDPNVVPTELGLVSFDGKRQMLGQLPAGAWAPRISPDGQHVAFMAGGDLYMAGLSNLASARRIVSHGFFPVFSPDGQWIAFESAHEGGEALYVQRSDGSGQAELVVKPGRAPEDWPTGDQGFSFISFKGNGVDYDLWTYSVKDKALMPLVVVPASGELSSRFSPDGRFVAYMSSESGDWQVYVQPYPASGARYQVTMRGGRFPLWSTDSRQIIYEYDGRLYSTAVYAGSGLTFGEPVALPVTGFTQTMIRRNHELTPDGTRFLMLFRPSIQVEVVSNWFEELGRRVDPLAK